MNEGQSFHSQLLEKIRDYAAPVEAKELVKQHPPLIIAGMSSVGKNTIAKSIVQQSDYRRVVTHTTRQPRSGEIDGKDYWFVDESEIDRIIGQQAFIEVQLVHEEYIYGTSIEAYKAVLDAGFRPLLLVDVHGQIKFTQLAPGARPFFILPPSFETWMERWDNRGRMSYTEKARRLRSAFTELEKAIHDERFILVVNQEVPKAAKEILDGVTDALTQHRRQELARRFIDHARSF